MESPRLCFRLAAWKGSPLETRALGESMIGTLARRLVGDRRWPGRVRGGDLAVEADQGGEAVGARGDAGSGRRGPRSRPEEPRNRLHRWTSRSAVVALLIGATLGPGSLEAQYFGRNKVRYRTFDFRILETPHFDVYYYPEEEAAARDAAQDVVVTQGDPVESAAEQGGTDVADDGFDFGELGHCARNVTAGAAPSAGLRRASRPRASRCRGGRSCPRTRWTPRSRGSAAAPPRSRVRRP